MDNRLKSVRRVLIFTAHADDCEFFCGGIASVLASHGAEITEVIATDNGRGSFELEGTALVTRSREVEAVEAARIIGKKHVEFLGYPDGFLDETPKNELRRIFMEWIRRVRPDCVMSFDPFASYETHPDHIHVAKAAVEAVGFAHLPLFHPEQIRAGLAPHMTPMNLWFSKSHELDNHVVDIGAVIDMKVDALLAHECQMRLMVTEAKMSFNATGRYQELLPLLDEDNPRPIIESVVTSWALDAAAGKPFDYGEGCRIEMVDATFENLSNSFGTND